MELKDLWIDIQGNRIYTSLELSELELRGFSVAHRVRPVSSYREIQSVRSSGGIVPDGALGVV